MNPYPDEPTFWDQYARDVQALYHQAGRELDLAAYRWFARCGYDTTYMAAPTAAAKHLASLRTALGLNPPPPPDGDAVVRGVQGYVRTEGKQWADDSGPRSMRICSWFPALRCYHDYPEAAQAQLRRIKQYWMGVRIFWHVWSTAPRYNPIYGVDPRADWFEPTFLDFLRYCQAIGLRVSLTCGDMQYLVPDGHEDAWHDRIARLVASVDQQTVGWYSIANESWQNMARGEDAAYLAHLSAIIQSHYPWNAHGLSDPFYNEEPSALDSFSRPPANFTLKHGTRDWPQCMNRAFNAVFEGHWLLDEDEPTGLGPDVWAPLRTPHQLFGLYTLILVTGQMLTYFGGHALVTWRPDEGLEADWGFTELPRLWQAMDIPDDAQAWAKHPGHHGEAAVYPRSFAVPHGQGPHRCDGAQCDARAFYVPCAGVGTWDIASRWTATARVWSAEGLVAETHVDPGQTIFLGDASMEARVVELDRR